jgi:hypothetical protein
MPIESKIERLTNDEYIPLMDLLRQFIKDINILNERLSLMFSCALLENNANLRDASMQATAQLNHLMIAASKNLYKLSPSKEEANANINAE